MTKIGIAKPQQLNWCGDNQSEKLYADAINNFKKTGAEFIEIDITPLSEVAALLYSGPWVAERSAAIQNLIEKSPDSINPIVRSIVERGNHISGIDVFNGIYKLADLARKASYIWDEIDILLLPTTPTIYKIKEIEENPVELNSNLGLYTNFVNLLDLAAIALPAGFRDNGTGFGISLITPAWTDRSLIAAGKAYIDVNANLIKPELDINN